MAVLNYLAVPYYLVGYNMVLLYHGSMVHKMYYSIDKVYHGITVVDQLPSVL